MRNMKSQAIKQFLRLADTSPDIIGECTIKHQSDYIDFDAFTGEVTNLSPEFTGRFIKRKLKDSYYEASTVQKADKTVSLFQHEWIGYIPEQEDSVLIDGITFKVISFTSDTLSIFWSLKLRGVNGE